ncbi:hypothetical protein OsJ_32973 [Oryza sativa Japonica Group]|uniref:Uncharacterized protein n=1 Tax=Oryza sativa subsp. japonica TaxID=39947 RepID=A3C8N2_ORYSJ|nr:hypothetical protein OsJ_32973 [Oryza sativa Japonica Group]
MQFFEAVAELQETLDLQDARARLARETRAKDASILAFAKKLREAHHVLDRLVDDYADYRRDPKRPRGAAAADDPEPMQFFEAVAELQETLDLQDARARLARETRAKDASILAFAKKLREAHHVLDRLVDDYADYRRDPKRPRGAAAADDPEPVSDGDFGASLHSKLDLLKQQLI